MKLNKKHIAFYILLIAFTFISQYAIGKIPDPGEKWFSFSYLLLFFFFIFLKQISNKVYIIFISIYFIFSLLLLGQSALYGSPSIGVIASIYETNPREAFEYIKNIPNYIYYLYIAYTILFLIVLKLDIEIKNKKGRYLLLIAIIIASFIKPIRTLYKDIHKFPDPYFVLLEKNSFYPINILANLFSLNKLYLNQVKQINKGISDPATWEITSSTQKYKNYVLIIGESMRKDYMSLYNYPIDNTPFLNNVKGIYFNHYISAAPNTYASLQRTLYRSNDKITPIYTDSIISLANSARFNTYWLSNQGSGRDKHDLLAAKVAERASFKYFTSDDHQTENISDRELLPVLDRILSQQTDNPKLVIIHLIGSHPVFCDRLNDSPKIKIISTQMSCYIETIKQTDQLINDINTQLVNKNEPYSVIYFSDHGLSHYSHSNSEISMSTNNQYKQNYEVPFIKFSSDDTTRTLIQSPKSAFDFMHGFAQWLGIKEKHLKQVDFFSENSPETPKEKIEVFNWKTLVDFESLPEDPAILPK